MKVFRGTIDLQSKDHRPDFHNVTDGVKKIVAEYWGREDFFNSKNFFLVKALK